MRKETTVKPVFHFKSELKMNIVLLATKVIIWMKRITAAEEKLVEFRTGEEMPLRALAMERIQNLLELSGITYRGVPLVIHVKTMA
jgi:hypothetical protein